MYVFIQNTRDGKQNLQTTKLKQSGFQEGGAPRFQDSLHTKVVRLSVTRTGRLSSSSCSTTALLVWPWLPL
jgi:hypothetical protein